MWVGNKKSETAQQRKLRLWAESIIKLYVGCRDAKEKEEQDQLKVLKRIKEGEEQEALNAQVHAATEALLEGHFVVAVKRHRCAKKIMSAKKVEDDSELKQLDKDVHEEATKLLLKKVLKFIPLVLGQKKEALYLLNEME